jgi:hypothetical protein
VIGLLPAITGVVKDTCAISSAPTIGEARIGVAAGAAHAVKPSVNKTIAPTPRRDNVERKHVLIT